MKALRKKPIRTGATTALLAALAGTPALAAEAQSTAQITIHAPADRVWRLLTEVPHWPAWNPAVASVRVDGPLREGTTFTWKSQGFEVTSTVLQFETAAKLSWKGSAFGTRAFHAWTLEQAADGVVVKTFETFDGWLPWLLNATMQKQLDQTLPAWLLALKVAAERGGD